MPSLSSIQNIYLLLVFVVPGFVALFVRSKFLTGNLPASSDAMMASFILSCVQAGVAFPVLLNQATTPSVSGTAAFWIIYLFAVPAILGAMLGLDARFNWSRNVLSKLRIQAVHPIPNSWDWHFRKQRPTFVIVTLRDGSTVRGWYGRESFASSDPKERDLFLESVYVEESAGKPWVQRAGTSILLAGNIVQTVEFVSPPNEEADVAAPL